MRYIFLWLSGLLAGRAVDAAYDGSIDLVIIFVIVAALALLVSIHKIQTAG